MPRRQLTRVLALLVATMAPGTQACSTEPARPSGHKLDELTLTGALRPFSSCEGFLDWVKSAASDRVGPYGLDPAPGYVIGAAVGAQRAGGDAQRASDALGQGRFSPGNAQVAGVDEPDIIKTDGQQILAVAQGRLQVLDVSSGEARVTDSLEIPGADSELLAYGDKVLVLSQGPWESPETPVDMGRFGYYRALPSATLTEVDVSDPTHLKVVATLSVEGSYLSARMVADVARVVLRSDPQARLGFVAPLAPGSAASELATKVNREVIGRSEVDDWLPRYTLSGPDGDELGSGRLVGCDDAAHPQRFSGFGMLSVLSLDLSDGIAAAVEDTSTTAVMAGGETIYASAQHLYVATTELAAGDLTSGPDSGTPDAEAGTEIHRFDISDPARASYEASGRLDGYLLSQFAMDEHDGRLRVATTRGSPSTAPESSVSQVTVLVERDGALVTEGVVSGLGAGEQIRSVRFLGELAYVVTFRQSDPLYVLDLSEPTAPVAAGELKVPGYSAYLHPLAPGWVLGVGRDATPEGAVLGVQLSLFDVRDPGAPRRAAQLAWPAGSSSVEWDHKAFNYLDAEGLAVFPLEFFSESNEYFSGALAVDVAVPAGTLSERARISHGAPALPAPTMGDVCAPDGPCAPERAWSAQVTRSVLAADALWTLSEAGIARWSLPDLVEVSWTGFA